MGVERVDAQAASTGVEIGSGCQLGQCRLGGPGDLIVHAGDLSAAVSSGRGGNVLPPPQVRVKQGGVVQEVVAGQNAFAGQAHKGLVGLLTAAQVFQPCG